MTWDMVHLKCNWSAEWFLSRRIAEMATGEGKRGRDLPLYLNALTGRGAHL